MTNQQQSAPREFERALEQVEIAAWQGLHSVAADSGGLGLLAEVKGCALVAAEIDVLAFNRVIGLGISGSAGERDVAEIVERYREEGVPRFFVQLHPHAAEAGLERILEAAGFVHYNNWVKLCRPIDPPVQAKTDLEIRPTAPEEASSFGRIVVDSFEWPGQLLKPIAATVGMKGWNHYMAYDQGKPVATGAFFRHGEFAWIDMAATLAEYRGRGAQSALLARRVKDARDLGCRWLVVETAEQTPEHEAPSYRNMVRYGFGVAYVRPNYLMKF